MRRVFVVALCCAFVLSLAAVPALAQDSSHSSPLIPTGWTIDPAGHEFGVSQTDRGFVGPLGAALSPDGSQLLAASGGAARIQSADLFDLSSRQRSDYVPYDGYQGQSTFYGVVFSPNGTRAWAAGGGQNVVHTYNVVAGHLQPGNDIPVPNFPAGLAYGHTPLGDRLYVANNLAAPAANNINSPGHEVTVIDPATN
jgi:sugar lactone lactonase YvrE